MKTIAFTDINTLDGFKAFLQAYHQQLTDQRSFPPLGIQKALHTAAPVFGYNDWHVMSAQIGVEKSTPEKATSSVDFSTRSESDMDIDLLAQTHRIEFTDLGDEWGWRSLNEVVESPYGWPTKEEAWASACEYYDIENPLEGRRSDSVPGIVDTPAAPLRVVTVTMTTLETDHLTVESVETKVFRDWKQASAHIADIVREKAMYNDRSAEEVCECDCIEVPDAEDREGMDDDDLLDWVIEHNDDDALIRLVSYLDYDLSTIVMSEAWI